MQSNAINTLCLWGLGALFVVSPIVAFALRHFTVEVKWIKVLQASAGGVSVILSAFIMSDFRNALDGLVNQHEAHGMWCSIAIIAGVFQLSILSLVYLLMMYAKRNREPEHRM